MKTRNIWQVVVVVVVVFFFFCTVINKMLAIS